LETSQNRKFSIRALGTDIGCNFLQTTLGYKARLTPGMESLPAGHGFLFLRHFVLDGAGYISRFAKDFYSVKTGIGTTFQNLYSLPSKIRWKEIFRSKMNVWGHL
jgi:hypothetical protein